MAVTFEDYYQTLGLKRDASAADVKRAYRTLARKYHPDVNKDDPNAATKFSKVSEAHDVLSDPEKRKKYDQFGENWKHGQTINPEDFGGFGGGFGGPGSGERGGGFRFESSGGGFSDFFESVFGRMQEAHAAEDFAAGNRQGFRTATPALQEHELTVSLHEALHGGTRSLSLEGPQGKQSIDVKIPAGVRTGSKIRLKEHGLLLKINLAPHPDFTVQGDQLIADVPIDPATAALGGPVDVQTPEGQTATLTVPPGTSSGAKLRLRGQGLPRKPGSSERGDLLARLMIRVPKELTDEQRSAYEALRDANAT
ncbi:MAG: J domain-containing protein [Planctomycetota bacterium]